MNKTLKTTIAGVATAATVGTSILFFNSEDSTNNTSEWKMPHIEVPELIVPSLPTYELANVELTNVELENAEMVNVDLYSQNNDIITTQNLSVNVNSLQQQFGNDIKIYEESFQDFIKKYKNLEMFKKTVKDERNADVSSFEYLTEWKQIYKEYANIKPIKFIPLQGNFKIISEIRLPKSEQELDNLRNNIEFYKSKGYNSALICFRQNDDPSEMRQLARYVRSKDMYVFFSYGGEERLNDDIYCNPVWFKEMLTNLAKESIGFMPWRRTSLHLWYPDKAWNNFVHNTLRDANPNIFIIGEIYYGMTAIDHPKIDWFFNIPENCSAVLLKNFGYKGFYLENIIKLAREKGSKNLPIIAVVHGEKPYYLTKNNTNKTFKENLKIKQELEDRFIKGGVQGTITMNDDGSDGLYNKNIVNNLSTYVINNF